MYNQRQGVAWVQKCFVRETEQKQNSHSDMKKHLNIQN